MISHSDPRRNELYQARDWILGLVKPQELRSPYVQLIFDSGDRERLYIDATKREDGVIAITVQYAYRLRPYSSIVRPIDIASVSIGADGRISDFHYEIVHDQIKQCMPETHEQVPASTPTAAELITKHWTLESSNTESQRC